MSDTQGGLGYGQFIAHSMRLGVSFKMSPPLLHESQGGVSYDHSPAAHRPFCEKSKKTHFGGPISRSIDASLTGTSRSFKSMQKPSNHHFISPYTHRIIIRHPPKVSKFSRFFSKFSVFMLKLKLKGVRSEMLSSSLTNWDMLRNIAHTKFS